jgi:hypothetical protein
MSPTTRQSRAPEVNVFSVLSPTLEVPQPTEPATPVVPDTPIAPIDPPDPTPADPERPSTVPQPDEPATPVVPEPSPARSDPLRDCLQRHMAAPAKRVVAGCSVALAGTERRA